MSKKQDLKLVFDFLADFLKEESIAETKIEKIKVEEKNNGYEESVKHIQKLIILSDAINNERASHKKFKDQLKENETKLFEEDMSAIGLGLKKAEQKKVEKFKDTLINAKHVMKRANTYHPIKESNQITEGFTGNLA